MKVIKIIGVSFALLMLATACDNPVFRTDGEGGTTPAGNVVIKIAGANGRTILPKEPRFSGYTLTLEKAATPQRGDGEASIEVDTTGIDGDGVEVQLAAGTWIITLKAYQTLLEKSVLAAIGSKTIEVVNGARAITVEIALNPLAIGESAVPGVFSYTVILPGSFETAVLSLKNSEGYEVFGGDTVNLSIEENRSGNIALAAGYYDLSIIITKNGQSAGIFESVHIYSGLESAADLDLNDKVAFADKVYIMGTLGGIRLGTVTITSDAEGTKPIETLPLNEVKNGFENGAISVTRSANWIIAIPSDYAGQPVYAVQEFNGVKSAVATVANPLLINGAWDFDALEITPATPALKNVAPWYAELTAGGGDNLAHVADGELNTYWQSQGGWLVLDFGFNVDVNAARLIFNGAFNGGYVVQYWNGDDWAQATSRAAGSLSNNDFFAQTVSASKFRWQVTAGGAPAVVEFGLYQAADRAALSAAILPAQSNLGNTQVSSNGNDIPPNEEWVTAGDKAAYQTAINAAQAARDNLFSTQQAIDDALTALNGATNTFDAAKQPGVTPDKDALRAKIIEAVGKKANVNAGTGSEYTVDQLWVTAAVLNALNNALTAAEQARDNANATKVAVDAALTGLTNAVNGFTPKPGTKDADKTALNALITASVAKLVGVKTSSNGADIYDDETWVTLAVKTALETALDQARAIVAVAPASPAAVNAAKETLQAAYDAFNPQRGKKSVSSLGIDYTFVGPQDETITLTGAQTLSWVNDDELRISVTETFSSYQWYVNGVIKNGATGNSITLRVREYGTGTHTVTLKVTTADGKPYTKSLTFTVN